LRVRLPNDFTPRPYQKKYMAYFDRGGKRAMWVVHRRGGKDLTALHQTVKMMLQRRGAYWHVYPTFSQARKAIWEGFTSDGKRIIDTVFPDAIVKSKNESEMKIELKNGSGSSGDRGSIWRLIGADKIEVVGAGPVGVVFSEYALARPRSWDLISPMLMENGGWASFVTTPRGRNHAFKLYQSAKNNPDWFCDLQTLLDTRAYDPEATIAAERAAGRPEALIRQEYFCDWAAANVGSVWGDLVEVLERTCGVAEFETPKDGVFTSWDLGHTDATAIWWWRIGEHRVPDVIDHYEAHGKPMSHYLDIVDERGYGYVKHYFPHDARAKSLQTGSSIVEQALARWPDKVEIAPQLSLADGIQAARWLLQQQMRIHTRCGEGLEALRHYHYKYDEDSKSFGLKPEHDWSSHTADAFRYLALVVKHTELMLRPEERKPKPPPFMDIREFTMDQLWDMRDRDVRERD
jgi:phage terminase large subunit